MKTSSEIKLTKNTVFVYKNVKGQSNLIDPSLITIRTIFSTRA